MNGAKGKLIAAMGIFGTVGIFVKYIPLPAGTIAFYRSVVALAFLLLMIALMGKWGEFSSLSGRLPWLCLSGVALGCNWVLLFAAYNYTTVATATVCYYLAPLLLVLASPLLGEKLTVRKVVAVLVALVGLVCMSGDVWGGTTKPWGIFLALGAAVLYACVVLLNKKMGPVAAYPKTAMQMAVAAVVVLAYMLFTDQPVRPVVTPVQWGLLLTLGIVHTGFAYALYFGAIKNLPARTVAVFSYLDPVISVFLSAVLLKEKMDAPGVIGTVLILGSALYSEWPAKEKV